MRKREENEMIEVGDRIRVIEGNRRFGPPASLVGELGTVLDTTPVFTDCVFVELDDGEEWRLHKGELEEYIDD